MNLASKLWEVDGAPPHLTQKCVWGICKMDTEPNTHWENLSRTSGDAFPSVVQEHALGCSVACVASRCGIPYPRALELFSSPSFAWLRGYYCVEVIEALKRAGLLYTFAAYEPEVHFPALERNGTIVFIAPCEEYPAGHYLIRTPKGWMNSWTNFPRIVPAEAGFQDRLPGKVAYVIFELSQD